jgi:cation-transporting ATPase 13A1
VEKKQREVLSGIERLKRKGSRKVGKDKDNGTIRKKKRIPDTEGKNTDSLRKSLFEVDDEISQVSLGFASVASPFTARTTSIKCVQDILLRGRCTIASMHQIYKILGINCLINAYQLTVLHLLGVRTGDSQLTASGIVVAILFLLVSKGEPLEFFSGSKKPPSSVLTMKIIGSVMMQFLCHSANITIVALFSRRLIDPYDSSSASDGAFHANILNTSTFIVSLVATVSTFWINYQGHPYMKSLHDNKALLRSLQISYVIIFVLLLEVFPPINDLLQLTELSAGPISRSPPMLQQRQLIESLVLLILENFGFKVFLIFVLCLDCVSTYVVEWAINKFL